MTNMLVLEGQLARFRNSQSCTNKIQRSKKKILKPHDLAETEHASQESQGTDGKHQHVGRERKRTAFKPTPDPTRSRVK